jgi:hypothetical protein
MRFTLLAALALLFLAASCTNETLDQTTTLPDRYDAEHYEAMAEEMLAEDDEAPAFSEKPIAVSAQAKNGLAAAVAAASPGATILVETGLHIEDGPVIVDKRVKIIGEPGAIVEFDSEDTPGFPYVADPGFHILNTRWVRIENLTIRDADQSGATGILIENSDFTRIRNNVIEFFELGIAQYEGLGTRVRDNTITGKTSFGGIGVLNVAGSLMKIYDNTIANNLLDIFVGGSRGVIKSNHLTTSDGGNIGILLCTPSIGGVYLTLPSGETVAAPISANRWFLLRNYSENHLWNYLVIDNANNNYLINNEAQNAVPFDIEMAGDSERFGFFTPTSFSNLTISTGEPDVSVKVCGVDNVAIGEG